jgi:hypothetical protein
MWWKEAGHADCYQQNERRRRIMMAEYREDANVENALFPAHDSKNTA